MEYVALVISVVGAFLGITSFYLTQLRPPRITVVVEKRIRVGYAKGGPGFGAYVPLTFTNLSSRTGVVRKIRLVLKAVEEDAAAYCIEFSRFSELDAGQNRLLDVSLPHAFAVPGHSSVSKIVRFMWWNDSQPQFIFGHHEYKFGIFVWTGPGERAGLKSQHRLALTKEQADELEQGRLRQSGELIEVVLDEAEKVNRVLGPEEIKSMFRP